MDWLLISKSGCLRVGRNEICTQHIVHFLLWIAQPTNRRKVCCFPVNLLESKLKSYQYSHDSIGVHMLGNVVSSAQDTPSSQARTTDLLAV